MEAIVARRSIKKFAGTPITRERLEAILEAAVQAPNHRMTQPWRFRVLGPGVRRAYGAILGARKARKVEDPAVARQVAEKVEDEHAALPVMIAVCMKESENAEIREEDYAATMMAVQNLLLAAAATGLGTHLKTGAVMQDPGARAAVGLPDDERIVAVIHAGEPAEVPQPRPRTPAADLTFWTD